MSVRKILVVEKKGIEDLFINPFFSYKKEDHDFEKIFSNCFFSFIDRSSAEEDDKKKQIIPYVLLRDKDNNIFLYKRKGNEKRLHGFYSIGVGGHIDLNDLIVKNNINTKDNIKFEIDPEIKGFNYNEFERQSCFKLDSKSFFHIVKIALIREIYEETGIKLNLSENEKSLEFLGFINEDISSVGKVHLGIVFLYNLDQDANMINPIDKEIDYFRFIKEKELIDIWDSLERWSLLALSLIDIDKTMIYISNKNMNAKKKSEFFNNFGFTEFVEYLSEIEVIENFKSFLEFLLSLKKEKKIYFYIDENTKFPKIKDLCIANNLIEITFQE